MLKWNKTECLNTESKDGRFRIRKDVWCGGYSLVVDGKKVMDGAAVRGFRTLKAAKEFCERYN